jgi:hypothetical protein
MICVEQSKDIVDYLVSLTPICVALFVAHISLRQARISREKLRLDLYNKRFEIYEITLSFYQSITSYDPSEDKVFRLINRSFIKAMKEAQFLFDSQSGIYQILQKMHEDSFKVTGFKRMGAELHSADPLACSKMHTEMQDVLTSFSFRIDMIEKAIAPYLNFHKVVV